MYHLYQANGRSNCSAQKQIILSLSISSSGMLYLWFHKDSEAHIQIEYSILN